MPAEPPEQPQSIIDLIEHANRLQGMRGEIVRQVNELFAVIAEVSENEQEGKYSALVELAGRMQDERDEARGRIQKLESELQAERAAKAEANARVAALERDSNTYVNALVLRSAAEKLRDQLHRRRMRPSGSKADAAVGAFAHEMVVQFDEDTKDLNLTREQ